MAKVLQFILSTITLMPIVSSTTYAQQGSKTEEGKASVYSDKFEGKKTASGDKFEQDELTAASKTAWYESESNQQSNWRKYHC